MDKGGLRWGDQIRTFQRTVAGTSIAPVEEQWRARFPPCFMTENRRLNDLSRRETAESHCFLLLA